MSSISLSYPPRQGSEETGATARHRDADLSFRACFGPSVPWDHFLRLQTETVDLMRACERETPSRSDGASV
jgi:hypothetical protein